MDYNKFKIKKFTIYTNQANYKIKKISLNLNIIIEKKIIY